MKCLLVYPSSLMYSEIYLRLEPLGLARVATALQQAGHDVHMIDLQVLRHRDYLREVEDWRPQAVGFCLNYLANIPEVIELAREAKQRRPDCLTFAGGHSVSFIPEEVLAHSDGAIDCIVRGEGERVTPMLLEAAGNDGLHALPGVVTGEGRGPQPVLLEDLDRYLPARDLLAKRRKYFIGHLDPCASVEFSRGCPWDCSFCSAWTFYGRSYRKLSTESVIDDLKQVREPNVFIVDDVAFVHADHGMELADAVERHDIRKQWYLETRCDVLLRNEEVFRRWAKLGLSYMFLGIEALDEQGLKAFRKRSTPNTNFKALEVARQLGIEVAINIIVDPMWDHERFRHLREWAMEVPEIVHCTVRTPYPGTEIWHSESQQLTTQDYRLFDMQHAVLPTKLPLDEFYRQIVETQAVLNRKHLSWAALRGASGILIDRLLHGQTNFARMLWKFSSVYNAERQYRDHQRGVTYKMSVPTELPSSNPGKDEQRVPLPLFVHGA